MKCEPEKVDFVEFTYLPFFPISIYIDSLINSGMLLIKFGGSVITDKSKYATFRRDNTAGIIAELKRGLEHLEDRRLIFVHGAGSFGHILAHENAINRGVTGARNFLNIVPKIRKDVRSLNSLVVETLMDKNFYPVSLPPEVILYKEKSGCYRTVETGIQAICGYLDTGFLPVMYGDVIYHEDAGFSICSGDDVINILSQLEDVDKIIFVTDVDGLYNAREDGTLGDLVDRCTPENVLELFSEMQISEVKDVTGSMYGKVCNIAKMAANCDVWIINGNIPGRLEAAMKGEKVLGTLIRRTD